MLNQLRDIEIAISQITRQHKRAHGALGGEDLAQEAALVGWDRLRRGESISTPYLSKTARNRSVDESRRRKRFDKRIRQVQRRTLKQSHMFGFASWSSSDPAVLPEMRERNEAINTELSRLDATSREIIVRRMSGDSFATIAARLGQSPSGVRKKFQRTLDYLRPRLESWAL